jgi:VWFA-related protein
MNSRPPRALLLAVGVLVGPVATGVGAQPNQRAVYVSVVDREGSPVSDLGPSDFEIREDNAVREVLRVAPATTPMQIALIVDNSQAASEFVRDYRAALPGFIDALLGGEPRLGHEIAIIGVAERPTILTDYTSSRARLADGIGRLFAMPDSGAYLLDGLIETSRGILKRRSERPVIVVLTTEGPELSARHYTTVLEPLRASGATLHVVTLGRPLLGSQDRVIALSQGARDTGGRYDMVLVGSALPSRLQEVAAELKSQYVVTYGRPQTLLPPERVTVKTTRPGLTARSQGAVESARHEGRP